MVGLLFMLLMVSLFYDLYFLVFFIPFSLFIILSFQGCGLKVIYMFSLFSFSKMNNILIILSVWCVFCSLVSMLNFVELGGIMYLFVSLLLFLLCCFSVENLLLFFIFFELSLVPMFFMILLWGYKPERVEASFYLLVYTLFGSMSLLFCILMIYNLSGTLDLKTIFTFRLSQWFWWNYSNNSIFIFLILLAPLIKLPLFGFHLWLPSVHVEAPVGGSMVLAGVLLKLGGYFLYLVLMMVDLNTSSVSHYLFIWGLFSLVVVAFICFRQKDIKVLIAYSSICHMALSLLGLLQYSLLGLVGFILMLVSHGLTSSSLFLGTGSLYTSSASRGILSNRGFFFLGGLFMFFWFISCVSKSSAPPSLKVLSEVLLSAGVLSYSLIGFIFLILSCFLVGLYSVYLYMLVSYGGWEDSKNYWFCSPSSIYLNFFLHMFPTFFIFVLMSSLVF